MTPDKVRQISKDLESLASSLAEIVAELRTLCDNDCDRSRDKPEPTKEEAASEAPKPQTHTLEEVRGILADKAANGHREAVQTLIKKHGASRLSDIVQSEYAALIAEAGALK